VVAPTVAPEHRVEEEPLPADPETEKLEGNVPPEDWVEPLEPGACLDSSGKPVAGAPKPCPVRAGIAMSEAKAARFGLYKIRYKELRTDFVSDRNVWKAQRELYEKRLQLADQAIQDLQPGWWDRHKAEFGVIGGFVLGAAMTIAIVSVAN
jgi:hypothetical protein